MSPRLSLLVGTQNDTKTTAGAT